MRTNLHARWLSRFMALAASLLLSAAAGAAPATYRFTGDITGTLAGTAVSGLLTLNVTGDTDDLFMAGPAQLLSTGVATFELAGSGTFSVTNEFYVFARPDAGFTGFGVRDIPICCDIIQIYGASLNGYDLANDFGPLAVLSNPSLADFRDVPTTAGLFSVTAMARPTFEAIIGTATVPEPGVLSLLAVAALAAGLSSARRGR